MDDVELMKYIAVLSFDINGVNEFGATMKALDLSNIPRVTGPFRIAIDPVASQVETFMDRVRESQQNGGPMGNVQLTAELSETLAAINTTLSEMKKRYERSRTQAGVAGFNYNSSFYSLQDQHGKFLVAELLAAKANVLMALYTLSQKEDN
jgi:hypothetical protein